MRFESDALGELIERHLTGLVRVIEPCHVVGLVRDQ